MIDPKELRICNWVIAKVWGEVKEIEVYSIGETQINFSEVQLSRDIEDDPIYCKDVNPIPITEEWLLRFGFHHGNPNAEWDLNGFGGYLNDSEFKLAAYSHKHQIIKFVHQLQNIYFALTGEELKIKETAK